MLNLEQCPECGSIMKDVGDYTFECTCGCIRHTCVPEDIWDDVRITPEEDKLLNLTIEDCLPPAKY